MLQTSHKIICVGFIFAVGLWILATRPAQSATTEAAITEFPTSGQPQRITTGPDGNLWFTESNAIGRITPDGVVTEYPLPSGISNPQAIAAGPDGHVWFTLPDQNKVGRIAPTGIITEITGFQVPWGITTDRDGNVWITESDLVAQITATGTITAFPITIASDPEEIIFGPDENLWYIITIVHKGGNKIGRITSTGVYTEFNALTWASGIYDLTSGRDGNIWFSEYWASKIGRITPGGVVTEFNLPLIPPGIHDSPRGIATGPDGNIWFAGFDSGMIGRVAPSGNVDYIAVPTPDSAPMDITPGPDGNIWFTEYWGQKIGRLRVHRFFLPLVMR